MVASQKAGLFFALMVGALGLLFLLTAVSAVGPTGGNVTVLRNETAPNDTAVSAPAQAGNVSEVYVSGFVTTQTWQGYYGNVTGVVQLADANRKVLYNWTLANPRGEIYASTNETIQWINIQCFNYTAKGTHDNSAEVPGATNLNGTNQTTLETFFNISSVDVDGLNETFVFSGAQGHSVFYTATQEFTLGECRSTRVYDDTGTGVATHFEEALLYEPVTSSVVFATILNSDELGFDGKAHDFEMLVLENGHGADTTATNYYFFVELQ